MSRGSLATAALLVLTALAGCLHVDEPIEGTTVETPGDNSTIPKDLKLPDNRTGEFNAFKETNITSGGLHNHDYWNGRTKVTILDRDQSFATFVDVPDQGSFAVIRLGVGELIYEGAERVELTISDPRLDLAGPLVPTQPAPQAPAVAMRYRHSSTAADAWEDGGAMAWGTPTVIPIKKAEWTDMPHSTGSLWLFRLDTPSKADAGTTFHVKLEIFRAPGDVVKWPGHPEFYANSHYRVIYDGDGHSEENFLTDQLLLGQNPPKSMSEPAKLVSYGTKTVLVFINVTSIDSPTKPTHIRLFYHNASWSTWNNTSPFNNNYTLDKPTHVFKIRVDPNGMDSPYAPNSRWEFQVRLATTTPLISCVGACQYYKVDYKMTVLATDLELDEYTPFR